MHVARNQAVALESAQCLGEHLLTDAADVFAEPRKTHLATSAKCIDHQNAPLVGDLLDDVTRKFIGISLSIVVGMKRIVTICVHGERTRSRGVLSSPDVADMTVSLFAWSLGQHYSTKGL
ncbi:hypothetical protein OKW49_008222 [Paraburkholderia youngii]